MPGSIRVVVHPGDAVVARRGGNVLVASPAGPPALQGLVGQPDEPAGPIGAVLEGALQGLRADDPTSAVLDVLRQHPAKDLPSLCAVTDDGAIRTAVVYGDVSIVIDHRRYSGRDAQGFFRLDLSSAGTVEIALAAETAPPPASSPLLDLVDGVVPGSGVTILLNASELPETGLAGPDLRAESVEAPAPQTVSGAPADGPPAAPVPGAPGVPDTSGGPDTQLELEQAAEPSPLDAEPQPPAPSGPPYTPPQPPAPAGPSPLPTLAADPNATLLDAAGPPAKQLPNAQLVGDDGETYPLDGDYVVGRAATIDPRVNAGEAKPLLLTDTSSAVSRVHAILQRVGTDLMVTDLNSSNGTFLLTPSATEWTRLQPDTPVLAPPGSRVLVGYRTLTYEAQS